MSVDKQKLVNALSSTVEKLHSLSVMVDEFKNKDNQNLLNAKVNEYILQLQELNHFVRDAKKEEILVPQDVLQHLDLGSGNNPELYTKQKLQSAFEESEKMEQRVLQLEVH